MNQIYIVVQRGADKTALAFGAILNWSEMLSTARAAAEELSRKNPGEYYMVFQCVGAYVQEIVWKPVEQKLTPREIGIYAPGTK